MRPRSSSGSQGSVSFVVDITLPLSMAAAPGLPGRRAPAAARLVEGNAARVSVSLHAGDRARLRERVRCYGRAAMRCLYVDLDGTLLGPDASLVTGADGRFSLLGARALEACARADVEVVIYSGRKQSSVFEAARLIGTRSYIFELGCGLILDGELEWLTDGLEPSDEAGTIYDQIEASGAPALLLEHFAGRLEPHTPWSALRDVSHLFRGDVGLAEAAAVLDACRTRLAATGRQRRHPGSSAARDHARARDRPRLPPDPGRLVESTRGGEAHAGARLPAIRVHRRRRLA